MKENFQITWVKNHLGPAIRNSSFSDLKIILHDDQITLLPALYEVSFTVQFYRIERLNVIHTVGSF